MAVPLAPDPARVLVASLFAVDAIVALGRDIVRGRAGMFATSASDGIALQEIGAIRTTGSCATTRQLLAYDPLAAGGNGKKNDKPRKNGAGAKPSAWTTTEEGRS